MDGERSHRALIRVREVAEVEAKRLLDTARSDGERAIAKATKAQEDLEAAESTRSTPAPSRAPASRLARADAFRWQTEAHVERARYRLAAALDGVSRAEATLDVAGRRLERAARERQAAQALESRSRLERVRQRVRRDQAAQEDGWRPTRRL